MASPPNCIVLAIIKHASLNGRGLSGPHCHPLVHEEDLSCTSLSTCLVHRYPSLMGRHDHENGSYKLCFCVYMTVRMYICASVHACIMHCVHLCVGLRKVWMLQSSGQWQTEYQLV